MSTLFYINSHNCSVDIFYNYTHFDKFLNILETAKRKFFCYIHLFSVMPTHYHLMLEADEETISEILKYLHRTYSMYIRNENKSLCSGSIFQQTDVVKVEKNYNAVELSFYLHAIPYLSGITGMDTVYEWSTLGDYIHLKKKRRWITRNSIINQSSRRYVFAYRDYRHKFNRFVEQGVSYIVDKVADGVIGGRSFRLEAESSSTSDKTDYKPRSVPVEEIIKSSEAHFDSDNLQVAQIYLCFLLSGKTNKEIGFFFGGVSASRISQLIKKAEELVDTDDLFKNRVSSIEKRLRKQFI